MSKYSFSITCLFTLFLFFASIITSNIEYFSYIIIYGAFSIVVLRFLSFSKEDISFITKFYIASGFVSMILVYHHQVFFNMPFDSYGDDQRYFTWAIESSNNLLLPSYSFYEKILGLVLFLYNKIGFESSVFQLLPINLIATSLCIYYSYKISIIVTGFKIKEGWIWGSLFLNYTFINNSVHLYRDVFIALFSVLFIYYWIQDKYKIRYVFLSAAFRLPNAVILVLAVLLDKFLSKNKKYIIISVVGFISFFILSFVSVKLGIQVGTKYDLASAPSMVIEHIQHFKNAAIEAGGLMSLLHQLPFPVKFFFNNIVQISRPFSINPFYSSLEYTSLSQVLDHRAIGWAITSLSLSLLVGRYISGLWIMCLKFKDKKVRKVALYFIVMTFVIGFLSFLDRHRIYIIILYPTMIALSMSFYKKSIINSKLFHVTFGFLFFLTSSIGILSQLL